MRKYLWLVTGILASLLIACGQPDVPTGTAVGTAVVPAQADINTQIKAGNVIVGEYVTVPSLKARIATAPIIIIGQITGTGEVINMARDIYDISKPAPDMFGVGQVYHFQVQQYLKGSGPDTLNIVQPEGQVIADPVTVTAADIQQSRTNSAYEYTAFQTGTTYLLFLHQVEGFDPANNYFTGAFHPWKFIVGGDGSMTMEAPRGVFLQLPADFIPDADAPLLPQIKQAIQAEQAAQP